MLRRRAGRWRNDAGRCRAPEATPTARRRRRRWWRCSCWPRRDVFRPRRAARRAGRCPRTSARCARASPRCAIAARHRDHGSRGCWSFGHRPRRGIARCASRETTQEHRGRSEGRAGQRRQLPRLPDSIRADGPDDEVGHVELLLSSAWRCGPHPGSCCSQVDDLGRTADVNSVVARVVCTPIPWCRETGCSWGAPLGGDAPLLLALRLHGPR